MFLYRPDYCDKFKCIASRCPDTCCSGWQVVVDEEALARYQALPEPLRSKLQTVMETVEGETIFIPCENGDCPFLQADHLCELYPLLGNEGLCFPCRTYPRIFEEYGLRREESLSLSCPEAARLILGSEAPITFTGVEDGAPLSGCNEIDADLYHALLSARTQMIALVQGRRAMPVAERAALLLPFAQELQEQISHRNYAAMGEVTARYADPDFLSAKRQSLAKYHGRPLRRQKNVACYFSLLQQLSSLHEDWTEKLLRTTQLLSDSSGEAALFQAQNDRFDAMFVREDYRFEHLMVYFLFRYALCAVDDGDLYGRIKFTVLAYLVIRRLLISALSEGAPLSPSLMIELSRCFSREIEHSPGNLAQLQAAIHHEKCFEIRQLLYTLLG